jgi:hypothetical protein
VKTFEEAALIVLGVHDRGEPLSAEELERLQTIQHAFMQDIYNSPVANLVTEMGTQIGEAVIRKIGDPFQIIPNIFVHALAYGVAIGVLMEKREE